MMNNLEFYNVRDFSKSKCKQLLRELGVLNDADFNGEDYRTEHFYQNLLIKRLKILGFIRNNYAFLEVENVSYHIVHSNDFITVIFTFKDNDYYFETSFSKDEDGVWGLYHGDVFSVIAIHKGEKEEPTSIDDMTENEEHIILKQLQRLLITYFYDLEEFELAKAFIDLDV